MGSYAHDPYGSGGGGGNAYGHDPYGGGGVSTKPPAAAHKSHGLLGFIENAGHDVGAFGKGLGPGLVQGGEAVGHDVKAIFTPSIPGHTGKGAKPDQVSKMIVKPLLKTYAYEYGPLGHGDVSTFLHRFYEHPLGPVLDALTVASGGAGAVAKVGKIAADAGMIADTSRLARLGEPAAIELRSPAAMAGQEDAHTLSKLTSGQPLRKAGQVVFDRAAKLADRGVGRVHQNLAFQQLAARPGALGAMVRRFPTEAPLVGEIRRYAREAQYLPKHEAGIAKLKMNDYARATRTLKPEEFAAVHLVGRFDGLPDPAGAYRALLEHEAQVGGHEVEPLMLKVLDNPKVRALAANPSPKVRRAIDAARSLDQTMTELKVGRGIVDPASAEARRFLPLRIAGGARYVTKDAIREQHPFAHLSDQTIRKELQGINRKHDRIVDEIAAGEGVPGDYKTVTAIQNRYAKGLANKGIVQPTVKDQLRQVAEQNFQKTLEANPDHPGVIQHLAERDRAARLGKELSDRADSALGMSEGQRIHEEGLHGGPSVEELKAAGHNPFYVPDVATAQGVANVDLAKLGGGKGVVRALGSSRQNRGLNFLAGRLALGQDVLGPEFLRAVKYGLFNDLHDALIGAAVRIHPGQGMPAGWGYLRRTSKERLGSFEKQRGDYERGLSELIPNPHRAGDSALGEGFTTTNAADAETLHGDRLIVPLSFAREMTGEFQRSSAAVRLLWEKPTDVWRALVLGGRVGYLTNNVVGNTLMYAIRYAGVRGLKGYLDAVRREKGDGLFRNLIHRTRGLDKPLYDQLMADYFPEQVSGTFIGSQMPAGAAGRIGKMVSLGVAPADKAYEGLLRRAGVLTELRKSAAFRRAHDSMPAETRSFEAAAREALDTNPELARQVSEKVNGALGNFLNMTPFEENVIRRIVPFYGWLRAITVVAAKMPIEVPLRTQILNQLAQIGEASTNAAFGFTPPSYLQGSIPIGHAHDGQLEALTTSGLNPFTTLSQEGSALSALLPGMNPTSADASNLAGSLNPVLGGFAQALSQATTPRTNQHSNLGLLGDILHGTEQNLPQYRLAAALLGQQKKSKAPVYASSKKAQLLAYLGVPLKVVNLPAAEKAAREGR